MKGAVLGYVLKLLKAALDAIKPELGKDGVDWLLDRVEKAVQGTDYEEVVMAACTKAREIVNVPDDDEDQSNPR